MRRLLCLVCLTPLLSLSQTIKFREYRKGNHFHYRLTTDNYKNNQFESRTISVSQHVIVSDFGKLSEEVRWIKKTVYKNDTLNLDSIAQKVSPYKISLQPDGSVTLPSLLIPEMTGEITDLNTFYVAVSPALHVHLLSFKHLSFKDSVRKGNFADGKEIIRGEDCMQVTQKLLIKEKDISVTETLFQPPHQICITPFADTIGQNMFETPCNFQMIRRSTGNKVNLVWGIEEFSITSTLDNRTGQLLKAEMINLLTLKMRYNSSEDLKTYEAEIPLTIKRVLKLELMK